VVTAGDGGKGDVGRAADLTNSDRAALAALQRQAGKVDESLARLPAAEKTIKDLEAKLKEASVRSGRQSEELAKARKERDEAQAELRTSETRRGSMAGSLASAQVMITQLNDAEARRLQQSEASAGLGEAESTPVDDDDCNGGGGGDTCPRPVCRRQARALEGAAWASERLRLKLEEAEDGEADAVWDNAELRRQVAELQRLARGGAPAGESPDNWSGRNGLRNLGRTCWMNGTLQLVSAAACAAGGVDGLVGALRAVRPPHDVELAAALAVVLAQMASPTHPGGVVDPRAFFALLGERAPAFRGRGRDQDATEFMHRLLELTTLGAVGGEQSVITSTTTTCGCCNGRSRVDETGFTLHVDFDETRPPGETPSLQALIDRTRRTETLDAENEYACSVCETLRPATRRVAYEVLPAPVLFIDVKRFERDTATGVTRKIATRVTYGDDLRIELGGGRIATYQLLGVLMHEGNSPSTGHYYAYVRGKDGAWLEMNDGSVRPAERVADTKASQGYVFAYERVDTPAPTPSAVTVRQAAGAPDDDEDNDDEGEGEGEGEGAGQQVVAARRTRVFPVWRIDMRHGRRLWIVVRAPTDAPTHDVRGT
jgi:ubiquitin C-terminal hydrolase